MEINNNIPPVGEDEKNKVQGEQTARPMPGAAPQNRPAQTARPMPGAAPQTPPAQTARPMPGAAPQTPSAQTARPMPGAAPQTPPAQTARPMPGAAPQTPSAQTARPMPGAAPQTPPAKTARPMPGAASQTPPAQAQDTSSSAASSVTSDTAAFPKPAVAKIVPEKTVLKNDSANSAVNEPAESVFPVTAEQRTEGTGKGSTSEDPSASFVIKPHLSEPQAAKEKLSAANDKSSPPVSAEDGVKASSEVKKTETHSIYRPGISAVKSDLPVPDKSRTSVLRPTAPIEDTAGTRVIPAQGKADKKSPNVKKEKKRSAFGERFREESNNAVLTLVKASVYLVCVLLVSVIISSTVIMVGNDIFAFVKSDDTVKVVVPEDASLEDIAQILAQNGIIKYPSVFKIYCEDKDAAYGRNAGVFVAGTYELRPSMDYEDLLASFKPKIPSGTTWITIPEGFTTDEIVDLLVEKGIGRIEFDENDAHYKYYSQFSTLREAYVDVINNYDFSSYWFVDELEKDGYSKDRFYRLDGYLFPDTYEFYNAAKPHSVINKFLARFSQIFTEEYRALAKQGGYSVDDIVILASMVEKEAEHAADYFNVSEVFRNRLENPAAQNTYTLDSDATVLYHIHHVTGERPNKTTREDTQLDVPYNTYIYKGLPPGAIANPSATSILAALNPSGNGYYFFVSSSKDTYFTTNYGDHQYYLSLIANGQA